MNELSWMIDSLCNTDLGFCKTGMGKQKYIVLDAGFCKAGVGNVLDT